MAEVAEESTHIPSSKQPRTVLFLSAMRHFALESLRADRGRPLLYRTLDDPANRHSLAARAGRRHHPPAPRRPGADGPRRLARAAGAAGGVARQHGLPLDLRDDRHFFSTVRDFADHARGRKRCAWSISTASSASATAC
jgi:deoxyribodipyrimidine photolyase-related protein